MQAIARGTLLDPEALTIGFARRFATYKRATPHFVTWNVSNNCLHNRWRPVQIVFAGKAHPADEPGRYFIPRGPELLTITSSAGISRFSKTTTCTWPSIWSKGSMSG